MAPATQGGARFFETYTRDLTREDLQKLFTRDTRDAYRFFARGLDLSRLDALPWHKRIPERVRLLFLAFTLKLSPARRAIYGISLFAVVIGLLQLFRGIELSGVPPLGFIQLPMPVWRNGTLWLVFGFLLMNLLVLLEVADRLSLKNDLDIAREIQLAMLPSGTFRVPGAEAFGLTRPANTVGGDFYDVLPLTGGRIVVALGDVAGKGSPAALLMALLLAMLRTLLDEGLEAQALVERLNVQIARHAPPSRFITLFLAFYDLATGRLTYVNAGQNPPLLRRADGRYEPLSTGGVALGMFGGARYDAGETTIAPEEMLVMYSDGITEAENSRGLPFDEDGLERVIDASHPQALSVVASSVLAAVAAHAGDTKFADDLTILLLRRQLAGIPADPA
jgi:serine phosphatase RsbU (regulator of sigma subunit)